MASIIELNVDLGVFDPIGKFLSKGDKDLYVERIINYDQERIAYVATLRKSDFILSDRERRDIADEVRKKYGVLNFEILWESGKLKTYRVIIIQKMPEAASLLLKRFTSKIFLIPPLTLSRSGSRINLLVMKGNLTNVRKFLNLSGIPYKVLSTRGIYLEGINLSQKERTVLRYAYENGFFDIPRRKKSDEVCKGIGISKSTLSRVIRGVEKKGVENLLGVI